MTYHAGYRKDHLAFIDYFVEFLTVETILNYSGFIYIILFYDV